MHYSHYIKSPPSRLPFLNESIFLYFTSLQKSSVTIYSIRQSKPQICRTNVQRPALICRLDVIIASFRCRLSSFNVPRPITCVTPSIFSGNHQFIIALFFFSGGWWNEFIHSRTKSRWYRAVIHENKIREKQKQKTKQKNEKIPQKRNKTS